MKKHVNVAAMHCESIGLHKEANDAKLGSGANSPTPLHAVQVGGVVKHGLLSASIQVMPDAVFDAVQEVEGYVQLTHGL